MAIAEAGEARVLTTSRDARLARDVLDHLEGAEGALTVEKDGRLAVTVPPEIGRVLQQVLDVIARGGTVTVGSVPEVVSTSTAARILGISRPTLMSMIKKGSIPSHMVGSHHRLVAADVFAALREPRARERAAFAELMEFEGDED